MDIDKQIAELEGKTTLIPNFGSKTIFIKIGVSLLTGFLLTYIVRPYYLLNIEEDPSQQKCVATLKMKYYILTSFILSIGIFFTLPKFGILND